MNLSRIEQSATSPDLPVDAATVRKVVEAVLASVDAADRAAGSGPSAGPPAAGATAAPRDPSPSIPAPQPPSVPVTAGIDSAEPDIDVADQTVEGARRIVGVDHPADRDGLVNLMASTGARLGVGRAGPRPRTRELLLFQADHAVTQDAIFSEVPAEVLDRFGMFSVATKVTDRNEYLLRPDLGRELSDEGRALVQERCVKNPDVQIVVGDGLSALAITNNLDSIYPVITQGLEASGLALGTPFFVRNARVGVINDINAVVGADVVVLLIGERPGLGVADALSVYSGWQPGAGKNDAHRDVTCMITNHGGMNPLEAGAFVVEHIRTVVEHRASGIDLRLKLQASR